MNVDGELKKMSRALGKAKDTLKEASKVTDGVSNSEKILNELKDVAVNGRINPVTGIEELYMKR